MSAIDVDLPHRDAPPRPRSNEMLQRRHVARKYLNSARPCWLPVAFAKGVRAPHARGMGRVTNQERPRWPRALRPIRPLRRTVWNSRDSRITPASETSVGKFVQRHKEGNEAFLYWSRHDRAINESYHGRKTEPPPWWERAALPAPYARLPDTRLRRRHGGVDFGPGVARL